MILKNNSLLTFKYFVMSNHPPLKGDQISSMMLALLDNRENFIRMLSKDAQWVEENPFDAINLFIDAVRTEQSKPFLKSLRRRSILVIPAMEKNPLPQGIIESFERGFRPIPSGKITIPETPITICKQSRDGTLLDIFGHSPKAWAEKSFSLPQIAGFCASLLDSYKYKCHNILLLLKDGQKGSKKNYWKDDFVVVRLGIMPLWSFYFHRLDSNDIYRYFSSALPYNTLVVLPNLQPSVK